MQIVKWKIASFLKKNQEKVIMSNRVTKSVEKWGIYYRVIKLSSDAFLLTLCLLNAKLRDFAHRVNVV